VNDGLDPEHGSRDAELAKRLRGEHTHLSDQYFELLCFACTHHTDGLTEGNVTVQTCWDSDRLDLARVGTRPTADRLCTAAAKNPATIAWAVKRSIRDRTPELITREWGLNPSSQRP
jgi:uncharacterized protein